MKLSNNWVRTELSGEYGAVLCGMDASSFQGIVKLNETGKFIWDRISAGNTEREIAEQMTIEYMGLSMDQAVKDVRGVIHVLQREGLLEE